MIVRKYTDQNESVLEVWVDEDHLVFEVSFNEMAQSIRLSHEDASDLKDKLYDLLREIEPARAERV